MRGSVYIHGHSDDLIEVGGDISAEFSVPLSVEGDGVCIEFDNGDRFRLTYDGEWSIEQERQLQNPYSNVEIVGPEKTDRFNSYTEVAHYQPWNGVGGVEIVDV